MKIRLYNTKGRKIEDFEPIDKPKVGMYACGMTVYDYVHIGHGRKYTMDDILRRTLAFAGYEVKHVQNVTDVGHLVSDEDEGEDKLEKGAKKSGMDVWQTAQFFTDDFFSSMDKLNILRPDIISKATLHIKEQIELIEKILANGFGYDTPEAVYFDVSKMSDYADFSGQKLDEKIIASREEIQTGEHKKNPADFALWFKRVGRFADHIMHWPSPYGDGFPGWHIECSAMSMKYLGETFDVHTGGVDHIGVHHTNEIAQSKAATGKMLANYWFHTDFLAVDGTKMSKSLGNLYRVDDVEKKGFSPLSLRYLYLGAHYRSKLNFTWDSLEAANNALLKLCAEYRKLPETNENADEKYLKQFEESLASDLNTPEALAVMWKLVKDDEMSAGAKRATLFRFDTVLGLGLDKLQKIEIPEEVKKLAEEREVARETKDWQKADEIRQKIEKFGFTVEDSPSGPQINQK